MAHAAAAAAVVADRAVVIPRSVSDQLLAMVPSITWKPSSRDFVAGGSAIVGFTHFRGARAQQNGLSAHSTDTIMQEFQLLVNNYLNETFGPNFTWTTLQINLCSTALPHEDVNNEALSVAMVLGENLEPDEGLLCYLSLIHI